MKDKNRTQKNNEVMKRQLEVLVNNTFEAIIIHDNGEILEVNQTFLNFTGYVEEDIIGKSLDIILISEQNKIPQSFLFNNNQTTEVFIRKKDGTIMHMEVIGDYFPYEERTVNILTLRNITVKKELDKKVELLAYYDELTGLPNRSLFKRNLAYAMANAQLKNTTFAVMFCDCDGFKKVNESHGHNMGDKLLKLVAKRFLECLNSKDTLSRVGGDEFTILIPQVNKEEAETIAKQLIKQFNYPFEIEGHTFYLTISIGISLYPLHGDNVDALIKNSDVSMNVVKRKGKNKYKFYETVMTQQNFNKLLIENELRNALNNRGFELYYQPQINLKTNEITGLEALIRWNHKDIGAISPAHFIPVAENSGLILSIGEWVLRTACIQNRIWQEKGYAPVRISVNFSAKQFEQPDLIEKIEKILNETELKPEYLVIEVTEITLLDDKVNVVENFNRIKNIGIKVDIDDFGTGYSSFGYLKSFPINKIKIDRSFISHIDTDKENQEITSAILQLGKGLGLEIIAEGIETIAELNYLKSLGCEEGQGYYFSRPLPTLELEELFKKQAERQNNN